MPGMRHGSYICSYRACHAAARCAYIVVARWSLGLVTVTPAVSVMNHVANDIPAVFFKAAACVYSQTTERCGAMCSCTAGLMVRTSHIPQRCHHVADDRRQ